MRKREFALLVAPSMLVMFGLLRRAAVPHDPVELPGGPVRRGRRLRRSAELPAALTDPRFGRAVLFTVVLTLIVTAAAGRARLHHRHPGQPARQAAAGRARHPAGLLRAADRGRLGRLLLAVRHQLRRRGQLPAHQPDRGRDPLVHRRLAEPHHDHPVHHLAPAAVQHADHPGRAAGRARRDHRGREDRRGHLAEVAPVRHRADHPGGAVLRHPDLDHGCAADLRPADPAGAAGRRDRQRVDHAVHLQHRLPRRQRAARPGQRDQRADHPADPDHALPFIRDTFKEAKARRDDRDDETQPASPDGLAATDPTPRAADAGAAASGWWPGCSCSPPACCR